jgi:hypothetical protein
VSELICDRSIIRLAIAQQFHSGAWRCRASDNCVTRWPNERNVEGRHDFIAAVRRAGRNHCGGRGSGFNWRLPFAREAEDKCRTTCRSKREKQEGYSAHRYGGHGTQPVAKSLARQCPPKSWCAERSRLSSRRTRIHAACEATPRQFGVVGGGCAGLVAGGQLASAQTLQDARVSQRFPRPDALAYNLGNFLRTLATPEPIKGLVADEPEGEADQKSAPRS